MVSDHFGCQAEHRTTRQQQVRRIFLAGLRRRGRGLPERRAQHETAEHRFGVPTTADEVDGQSVEQLRVRGQVALHAEVLARGDEASAKDLGPESVDDDA